LTGIKSPNPCLLNAAEWKTWKEVSIMLVISLRRTIFGHVAKICSDKQLIDATALMESEEEIRAQLEARIIRPKNFTL
jgi:hypothetical protein